MERRQLVLLLAALIARLACAPLIALALATAPPALAAGIHAGFQAETLAVAPGATFTAGIRSLESGAAFNAFDASVLFDPAQLTFVPTVPVASQRGPLMTDACTNTFHLFSAYPESLASTLVLLCNQTSVTGPGTIYRVQFRAGNVPAMTLLRFGANTRFYLGGTVAGPLETREMVVRIGDPGPVGVPEPAGTPRGLVLTPPSPNPSSGGRGLEMSFGLPRDDRVGVDLLDAQGRRVAWRDWEPFGPGVHRIRWSPPGLPPGRYLLRLRTAGAGEATHGWVLLR